MIKSGLIEEVVVDGYERYILVSFYPTNKKYWVHLIQHEEYLESGERSEILRVGQSVELEIGIDLVIEFAIVEDNSHLIGVVQPIKRSPHTLANGLVTKIIDDFSVECSVEGLGDGVLIEFERKVQFKVGDHLKVKGSIEGRVVET